MFCFMSRAAFVAGLILTASLQSAHADAIDGDWCFSAQSLNIQGQQIRTPGGQQISGDYSRHAFSYTVPASEPGAGSTIAMQLLSEETMTLTRSTASAAAPEVWKRCKPIS